jgi:hypothetical protein
VNQNTLDESFQNPFAVRTPEHLSAVTACELFVNVLGDMPKITESCHAFLHGPRGSGKSMILRYLLPDCQRLKLGCRLHELPFYAVYVPIKVPDFSLAEFARTERHAAAILGEHFLTMHAAFKVFKSMCEHCSDASEEYVEQVRSFLKESLVVALKRHGWSGTLDLNSPSTIAGLLELARQCCLDVRQEFTLYLSRLSFQPEPVIYNGPLCNYYGFLLPLLQKVVQLPFMPQKTVFLLIDDADNLPLAMTKVLNTWAGSRTSGDVSLKISTQMQYKTYETTSGFTIDSPHDYSEVNISTIYTTRYGTYLRRLQEIVRKRLDRAGVSATPQEFFPPDADQEAKIEEIAEQYASVPPEEARGYRPSDDAHRYSRPDFIASLGGTSKSSRTYSYAGFEQLVHVSSGIVRNFLEPAASMYYRAKGASNDKPVTFVPPGVQDTVIREESERFLIQELERKGSGDCGDDRAKCLAKLSNLIEALGGTFKLILRDKERTERRVFSIAFSDDPDEETKRVLKLGEVYGYFHVSTIGRKDGLGRTKLYILSRMLAPYYNLDPTGFAGYLFVTNENIRKAMDNPQRLLRQMRRSGVAEWGEQRQLALLEESD